MSRSMTVSSYTHVVGMRSISMLLFYFILWNIMNKIIHKYDTDKFQNIETYNRTIKRLYKFFVK